MDLRKIPKNVRWIFQQQKTAEKLLKPKIKYSSNVDILDIWFGGSSKVEYSVETKDIIFDLNRKGVIIGLEILDFKKHLKNGTK